MPPPLSGSLGKASHRLLVVVLSISVVGFTALVGLPFHHISLVLRVHEPAYPVICMWAFVCCKCRNDVRQPSLWHTIIVVLIFWLLTIVHFFSLWESVDPPRIRLWWLMRDGLLVLCCCGSAGWRGRRILSIPKFMTLAYLILGPLV